jgi:hypothetical protein
MATIAVGAPPAQQAPEAQPRTSWFAERGPAQFIAAIAAVLGGWIVLFFFLRGRNTLALAPADTKPLHVWLSDLQTRVGEGRNTNPLFTYFFNPIRSVIDAFGTAIADLIAHRRGNADAARFRYRFEPRGNVDAVAKDIVSLRDHVTEIEADAVDQDPRRRHVTIALRHALLKVHGTAQRFGDALEFHQHAVTGGLDDAALAFGDRRVDELQAYRFQSCESPCLIDFHETAVADDIRREDGGKPAFYARRFRLAHGPLRMGLGSMPLSAAKSTRRQCRRSI